MIEYDQLAASLMRDQNNVPPHRFDEVDQLTYYTKGFRRMISRDGFGEVFMGWVIGNDNEIIHKLAIKRSHSTTEHYRRQWQAERDYLSTLHHPNIIKLVGYAENENMYLANEYMETWLFGSKVESVQNNNAKLSDFGTVKKENEYGIEGTHGYTDPEAITKDIYRYMPCLSVKVPKE
ncbi:hypothetical protein DITRI_Ditri06bG0124100 [Diplodiscus trichospermus]